MKCSLKSHKYPLNEPYLPWKIGQFSPRPHGSGRLAHGSTRRAAGRRARRLGAAAAANNAGCHAQGGRDMGQVSSMGWFIYTYIQ